jgi:hypothetical protein
VPPSIVNRPQPAEMTSRLIFVARRGADAV